MSFAIRRDGRYLHHNLVVAMLNDLFGIQSRGGCSCAGPYGHRLLGIGAERSTRVRERDPARLRRASSRAGSGSTSTTSSPTPRSTTSSSAIELVADARLGPDPRVPVRAVFGPVATSRQLGRAAAAAGRAALRRATVALHLLARQATARRIGTPALSRRSPASSLGPVAARADRRVRPVTRPPVPHTEMTAEFERLRWFELPDVCLEV